MPEFHDLRYGSAAVTGCCDLRQERELIRRGAEAEAKVRAAIERKRHEVAERGAELQAQIDAAKQTLEREREAIASLQIPSRKENDITPEAEEAMQALEQATAQLDELKARSAEHARSQEEKLETSQIIYELYLAGTGIRWDMEADCVQGYVDMQHPKHFSFEDSDPKATADALWETIEQSLSCSLSSEGEHGEGAWSSSAPAGGA